MNKHAVLPRMIRQTRPGTSVWTRPVVITTAPAPTYALEAEPARR